jgi:hypothetical protein
MEVEDYLQQARAQNASLQEEVRRLHIDNEAKDREIALLHEASMALSKENLAIRKHLQSWASDADAIIAKARRAELEALEL